MENGDLEWLQVTHWIQEYMGGTEYAGGIETDLIKDGVSEKLSQYPIDENVIEQVAKDVINELESRGVKFYK
jgi:hypothetical protein